MAGIVKGRQKGKAKKCIIYKNQKEKKKER
jgi:hypothetical protein